MNSKLEQETFHIMRQVFQQHTSQWQQALPALTKPQYAVLRAIAEQPGIEQVVLAEVAVSSKATLAEMLARLEARGLIRRVGDPDDKRRRLISLTPEGERLLLASQPTAQQVDNQFLSRLSTAEQQVLNTLLLRLVDDEKSTK